MSATRAAKIRVGIFVVVASGLLAVAIAVFAGLHLLQHRDRYEIVFTRSVYGLEKGADVHMNGIRVGSVTDLSVLPEDIRRVRVIVDIDAGTPVRTDTTAVLRYAGITGLKVVDMHPGAPDATRLAPGGRIQEGASAFDKLEERAVAMLDDTSALMERVTQLVESAHTIVDHLAEITDPDQLGGVVRDTRRAARDLARAGKALRETIDETRPGLERTLATVEEAAAQASRLLANRNVHGALADLRQATRTLKDLSRDLRQRPSRLLFSRPPKERKLP